MNVPLERADEEILARIAQAVDITLDRRRMPRSTPCTVSLPDSPQGHRVALWLPAPHRPEFTAKATLRSAASGNLVFWVRPQDWTDKIVPGTVDMANLPGMSPEAQANPGLIVPGRPPAPTRRTATPPLAPKHRHPLTRSRYAPGP